MPYNGSGSFTVYTPGNPAITGTSISSTAFNNTMNDFATGLSTALTKDGQTPATGNIPLGGNKVTGLGNGTARTDALPVGQEQDGTALLITGIAGTNTITGNLTPAITAYTLGQAFRFISAGANTGAVTININGLGAKAITKSGATALSSGDIPAGAAVTIIYDGTQFQLSSGAGSSSGGGGGGATGAGTDQVFYENDKLATGSYTIGNAAINIACTFTNGSAVVTAANTFVADQPVRFNTAGTLPTNFSTSAFYYVISTGLSSSAFQVSSTIGGAAIVAGSAGTGTHTVGKVKDVMVNRVLAVATGQTITFPTGVVTQVVGGGTPGGTDLYVSTVTNQTVGGNKTYTGTATFDGAATFATIPTFASTPKVTAAQSMVSVNNANGYGSTNTAIRRFSTIGTNQGSDITYADSATFGALFTINTNGVYAISYIDSFNGINTLGASLNTSSGTALIYNLAVAEILVMTTQNPANGICNGSWIGYLPSGSLVRPHTDAAPTGSAYGPKAKFTITRVS